MYISVMVYDWGFCSVTCTVRQSLLFVCVGCCDACILVEYRSSTAKESFGTFSIIYNL